MAWRRCGCSRTAACNIPTDSRSLSKNNARTAMRYGDHKYCEVAMPPCQKLYFEHIARSQPSFCRVRPLTGGFNILVDIHI
jgi:hypothetical protein